MQPTLIKDFTPGEALMAVSLELSKASWKVSLHHGKRNQPTVRTVTGERAQQRLLQAKVDPTVKTFLCRV
jgi:transposase